MAQNSIGNCAGSNLCGICGPSIDTSDVPFGQTEANLVYMDKVYAYDKASACPILETIPATTEWITETILTPAENREDCICGRNSVNMGCGGGCTCCCTCGSDCTITADAVFNITKSYVIVSGITLADGTLTVADVTVDGTAVDSLTQAGGRYTAEVGSLITKINRRICNELSLPSKNFFLITGAGPWTFNGAVVLEGTVNTGGKTCCFVISFRTPEAGIAITGESTFAIPKLALPCSVGGVSPTIGFGFTGKAYVLSPEITATAGENGAVTLSLAGSLVLQPQLNAEVVRKTLFCLNACEAALPCDGTEAAYELDAEDDCTCRQAPICRCGTVGISGSAQETCGGATATSGGSSIGGFDCGCGSTGNTSFPDAYQWLGCSGCSW